jgi:hypothetical protein
VSIATPARPDSDDRATTRLSFGDTIERAYCEALQGRTEQARYWFRRAVARAQPQTVVRGTPIVDVRHAALSPDGRVFLLVTGGGASMADARTGEARFAVAGWVPDADFVDGGRFVRVQVNGPDGSPTTHVLDVASLRRVASLPVDAQRVQVRDGHVFFVARGAGAANDDVIRSIDTTTGLGGVWRIAGESPDPDSRRIETFDLSPDGLVLVARWESHGHVVHTFWETAGARMLASIPGGETEYASGQPQFSPDGRTIAVAALAPSSKRGAVALLDRAGGRVSALLEDCPSPTALGFSPDSRWLVVGDEHSACIYDAAACRLRARTTLPGGEPPFWFSFIAHGAGLLEQSAGQSLGVFDVKTGRAVWTGLDGGEWFPSRSLPSVAMDGARTRILAMSRPGAIKTMPSLEIVWIDGQLNATRRSLARDEVSGERAIPELAAEIARADNEKRGAEAQIEATEGRAAAHTCSVEGLLIPLYACD